MAVTTVYHRGVEKSKEICYLRPPGKTILGVPTQEAEQVAAPQPVDVRLPDELGHGYIATFDQAPDK